jgi:hypothetical protein
MHKILNFQVSRYVNFINSNFYVFVCLYELQVLTIVFFVVYVYFKLQMHLNKYACESDFVRLLKFEQHMFHEVYEQSQ